MTDLIDAGGLAPGQIRFVHAVLPPLDAGEYQISVGQTVARGDVGTSGRHVFTRTQHLHVVGPRFGLAPSDVHAVYPPANSAGSYAQTLPHVVLRRRTLPWEIDLLGDNARRRRPDPPPSRPSTDSAWWPAPWMALLVFRPGEAPPVQIGQRSVVLPRPTSSGPRTPSLSELATDRDPQVAVIDVDAATFRAVMPAVDDLPWTAHARQVRTDGKELLGLTDDGWFSVVIANRLPAAGQNTVHLVSLEGWAETLTKPARRNGPRPFRMISLASWAFTSDDRGSFDEKMRRIDSGPLTANRPPPRSDAGEAARIVGGALADGFVPLRYDMRHGEQTVAWFRGPLTPVPVDRRPDRSPLASAEAGLVYHPGLAMFDVSYAVAWQIGRLLALSDSDFAAALMRWRQAGQARVDRLAARDAATGLHGRRMMLQGIGDVAADVATWRDHERRLRAGEPGLDEAALDDERSALVERLRALVLQITDPDAIATAVAHHVTDDVLTSLVDQSILRDTPSTKTGLRRVRDDRGAR